MSWAESYHGKLRAMAGDEEVLIMIAARCLLRDDQGHILLIKRSDNGLWAIPAGGSPLALVGEGRHDGEHVGKALW